MEATETPTVAANQSVEKGVYLTPFRKIVHACKVREDIGAGITRCGIEFLMDMSSYRPGYQYGVPENAGADGTWNRCPKCESATDYAKVNKTWGWWKGVVKRTLKMIGAIKSGE